MTCDHKILFFCYLRVFSCREANPLCSALLQKGWNSVAIDCAAGLEIIAFGTISDVELVTHHREPHGMGTEQQLAVFDGRVKAEVEREMRGSAAVPAGTVARFRIGHQESASISVYLVCCGT